MLHCLIHRIHRPSLQTLSYFNQTWFLWCRSLRLGTSPLESFAYFRPTLNEAFASYFCLLPHKPFESRTSSYFRLIHEPTSDTSRRRNRERRVPTKRLHQWSAHLSWASFTLACPRVVIWRFGTCIHQSGIRQGACIGVICHRMFW